MVSTKVGGIGEGGGGPRLALCQCEALVRGRCKLLESWLAMVVCWARLPVLLLLAHCCLIALHALPALRVLPALCALPFLCVLRALLQLDTFPAAQVGLELPLLVLTLRQGAAVLIECLALVLATVQGAPAQVDSCAYPELQQSATLVFLQVAFPVVQVGW